MLLIGVCFASVDLYSRLIRVGVISLRQVIGAGYRWLVMLEVVVLVLLRPSVVMVMMIVAVVLVVMVVVVVTGVMVVVVAGAVMASVVVIVVAG